MSEEEVKEEVRGVQADIRKIPKDYNEIECHVITKWHSYKVVGDRGRGKPRVKASWYISIV